MLKTILKLSLAAGVLLTSQACTPGATTPSPNTVNTAIAQTMTVLTQTPQPGIPITGGESPTPTLTAGQILSPTATATPIVVQVTVSAATNCRLGPSPAYPKVGGLTIGQVAQVIGRSADGGYWIIQNPDRPGQICWLWGQFAAVTGNISVLPVYTPPPPPTASPTPQPSAAPSALPTSNPAFTASFSGKESCVSGGWWLEIELKNSGGVPFRSISMNVTDTATSTSLLLSADNFTNRNGCTVTDTRPNLPAGGILSVSSPAFKYDPSGHEIRADVTLCSNRGQNGSCESQTINFTP